MIELYPLLRPALFALEAERAHALSLAALRLGLGPRPALAPAPELAQDLMGLRFANPIGLAAGYDKDAIAPDALIRLGFGFVEVGTVTPRPQAGNLRPRVFRLPADRAVINRLGFNSAGQATVRERLAARRFPGVLGVNIGANAASRDRVADYAAGAAAFAGIADYLTINVSSPNTPALRELQGSGELGRLLAAVRAARGERRLPVLVKIAPDLSAGEIATVVETAIAGGADGLVVSNTTAGRPALREALLAAEPGGLSGAPLFDLSTKVLARARAVAGDRLTLIGVGGVGSAEQALAKIAAGASLVQLYTAMVYQGPGLAARIVGALPGLLRKAGFAHVSEAVGSDIDRYDTLEGR